ncbi:MAG: hypothetical protein AAF950_16740 [Pseudomonadota bacterium]
MRDLFDQGRALSPALIRSGTGLLGALLGIAAIVVVLQGLGNVLSFSSQTLTGIIQIAGGLGFLLAVYLMVRLLSEAVLALHRLNDRLTVLGSDLGTVARASAEATKAEPKADPKPIRKSRAKTAAKTTTPQAEKKTEPKPEKSASAAEV